MLNTCTSEALQETLRFLKRCYWPFPWSSAGGGYGGFVGAATVFLEGESDAAMQAGRRACGAMCLCRTAAAVLAARRGGLAWPPLCLLLLLKLLLKVLLLVLLLLW